MKAIYARLMPLLGGIAALCGCATTPVYNPGVPALLVEVLTTPISIMESRAEDQNDGRSQYGLSLLYEYGLRGLEKNPERAQFFRSKAIARRGNEGVQTVQPATSTSPTTTKIATQPRFDPAIWLIKDANKCAAALDAHADDVTAAKACQGEGHLGELRGLWEQARQ